MKDTKDRILKAALGQFSRHGLRRTSIRDIAEAAHVAKSALYYYFKSKEDIYATILESEIEGIWQKTVAAVKREKDSARKLAAYLSTVTMEMRRSILVHDALNDEFLEQIGLIEKIVTRTRRKEINMLIDIIRDGISSGEFCQIDASKVARTIVYAFEGLLCSPLIHETDILGDDQNPGLVFQMLLHGLKSR